MEVFHQQSTADSIVFKEVRRGSDMVSYVRVAKASLSTLKPSNTVSQAHEVLSMCLDQNQRDVTAFSMNQITTKVDANCVYLCQ